MQRAADGVCVVTSLVDDTNLGELLRAQHAAHGLTASDATVLARALAGTLDTRTLGNDERVALARLQNAGILDDTQLTEETGFSLLCRR